MKRLISICLSLIVIFSSVAFCFADGDVIKIDRITGEVVTDSSGSTSTYVKLTTDCTYDKDRKMFVYTTSAYQDSNVYCSVFSDMITTNPVSISADSAATIEVYLDGELLEAESYSNLYTPGSYVVRNTTTDSELLCFTIVNEITSAIYAYSIPSVFYVSKATYNDQELLVDGNNLKLAEDGDYYLSYGCTATGVMYELSVTIDHTAPELEIIGPVDGVARCAVSFGPTEDNSTVELYLDGEQTSVSDELKTAGDYTVHYTDEAGNTSIYYFTINVFFDGAAWVFVGLVAVVLILAGVYMIHSRRHMRTR